MHPRVAVGEGVVGGQPGLRVAANEMDESGVLIPGGGRKKLVGLLNASNALIVKGAGTPAVTVAGPTIWSLITGPAVTPQGVARVIDGSFRSVTVINWFPAVSQKTSNEPEPWLRTVLVGAMAAGSVMVTPRVVESSATLPKRSYAVTGKPSKKPATP